jgi:hypothetical protein
MEDAPAFYGFKNIFLTMFATFFFFKLLIKVFLALLTHFYIVKGNRKEAARIAEEIYGGLSGKKDLNFFPAPSQIPLKCIVNSVSRR